MKIRKMIFTTALSALVCFGLTPAAKAIEPAAPDTALAGGNTADGQGALVSLTTGLYNSAFGFDALLVVSDASFDTGLGAGALLLDDGGTNTAVGAGALFSNSIASDNNAIGPFALFNNDSDAAGSANFNNAHGRNCLLNNVDGDENDAFGDDSMEENTTGSQNTAMGDDSLDGNTTGSGNVAIGKEAGNSIIDGNDNVVLGHNAGIGLLHANRNVAIGTEASGPFLDLDDTCFIGSIHGEPVSDPGTAEAVFVDQFNVVGINPSSRRYKHDIEPMNKASETLFALKPVTFKYNSDAKAITQFGLIAEEVAQANPDLVAHNRKGEISTVRYEQINAMLLNEFLKEHKKVEEQQASISQLKSDMQTMVTQLKDQAAQIQRVSAELQVTKPTAKVVLTNP